MSVQEQPVEEFCPRCGVWVSELDEWTGWCEPCATSVSATTVDSEVANMVRDQ